MYPRRATTLRRCARSLLPLVALLRRRCAFAKALSSLRKKRGFSISWLVESMAKEELSVVEVGNRFCDIIVSGYYYVFFLIAHSTGGELVIGVGQVQDAPA